MGGGGMAVTALLVLFLTAGVLVLLSAALTAAESAVYALGPSRVRTLVEEGFRGAERLHEARENGPAVAAAVSTVVALLDYSSVAILVGASLARWGAGALAVAGAPAVFGVLLVSGVLPRWIAARASVRLALAAAPSLLFLARRTRPFLAPLSRIEWIAAGRLSDDGGNAEARELREIAELGRREGVVEEAEHLLVERAFRMDELMAWDVMVPRVDMFALKDSLTLKEIVLELRSVPYSRVPVYGENIDDVTGILHVREAYEAYVRGQAETPLSKLSRDPFFVPSSLSLPQLLQDFQARRIHMGIVADEFGGTDGLVTLEDVIEELVGEIEDETDISAVSIHRISKNELEVDGCVELRELNYAFNVSLPHLHRSLNGFLLEELGRVPAVGEQLRLPGLEIEVLESTDAQVTRARLVRTQVAAGDDG